MTEVYRGKFRWKISRHFDRPDNPTKEDLEGLD
jgi:hypothetical protein